MCDRKSMSERESVRVCDRKSSFLLLLFLMTLFRYIYIYFFL